MSLRDLAKLYAVPDLSIVWNQSRIINSVSLPAFLLRQRAIVIKASDGKPTVVRFSIVNGMGSGEIQPPSCAAVLRSGESPKVGVLGEGSLEIRELPEKHSYLIEIQKTYVLLLLGSWSGMKWEARRDNPDILYLYQRRPDGKILYVGIWEKDIDAMIDAAPEFCKREAIAQ